LKNYFTRFSKLKADVFFMSNIKDQLQNIDLTRSTMVLAAEGWGVLGGLMGWSPAGVSARMWK
jgi:hypothetical protein